MGNIALPQLHRSQTIVCFRTLEMFKMDGSADRDFPTSGR